MNFLQRLTIKQKRLAIASLVVVAIIAVVLSKKNKSTFLPPFPEGTTHVPQPVLREEVGSVAYPQGHGVGMNISDSNALPPKKVLLKSKTFLPQAYGESSLADANGTKGTVDSCRVLELSSMGNQNNFKPYSKGVNDHSFMNPGEMISYGSDWRPSKQGLKLACQAGKNSPNTPCQEWLPRNFKIDGLCVTAGDLPYDDPNLPNPRLVSRPEFFTGNFQNLNETTFNNGGSLFPVVAQ